MAAELEIALCLRGSDQSYRQRGITSHWRADGRTSIAASGDVEHGHVYVAVIVGYIDKYLEETDECDVVGYAGLQIIRRHVIVDGQRDNRGAGSYGRSGGQGGRPTG